MLDENLPTFFFRQSSSSRQLWPIYFGQHGGEPCPTYALRYPDPTLSSSKNRYAVALYDPYVPDIVYGEVLITPEWTKPNLSTDAARMNGGSTPPPEPILPSRFTIQLYNPDQKIVVAYKHKTWNTPATWEFEMPQHSFRQPSASTLDHTLNDPAIADVTPRLKFIWRRDSKLSKDLTCLLSGKTTKIYGSSKRKEPDITVSIYKAPRELTLYEPNLYRVEMEDFKGLEVVLLLSAVTIRNVYFMPMKEVFHLSYETARPNTQLATTSKPGTSNQQLPITSGVEDSAPPRAPSQSQTITSKHELRASLPERSSQNLPVEIVAEDANHRRQQEIRAQEEARKTKEFLEAEEKARREEREMIDRETRRLQMLYGQEEARVRTQSPVQPRPQTPRRQSQRARPVEQYYGDGESRPPAPQWRLSPDQYRQPPPSTIAQTNSQPEQREPLRKRSGLFGFRRTSGPDETKLNRKSSSMF